MSISANAIPDEIYYHFAKKTESIDALIRTLYTSPTALSIAHFKAINSHLKNDQVQAGQLIIITPVDSLQCSRFEAELVEAALVVDKNLATLASEEQRVIAENYQLLNNIASTGGVGYGAALIYFSRHVKDIENTLRRIERLYVKTYNKSSKLNSPNFFQHRQQLFMLLNLNLKSFVGQARMGFTLNQTDLKRGLGLSTKSVLHQWKQQPGRVTTLPGFEKNYQNVARLSKTLKGAGYVGIALDVGKSGLKIHQACTVGAEQSCGKTTAGEGGRLIGSVGGGLAGYGLCNLVFSIPSAGTSLLWCGIVAGVAGSYAGGKYIGEGGKWAGEAIYETVYQ
ncbi:MAG: hypothetical protein L3J89_09320 [Gammaproteobacteria bacterium]|nr:hypothetical protein [Gammaproteobacteria bacterium]